MKLSDKQFRTEKKKDWVFKRSALIKFLPSFPLKNSKSLIKGQIRSLNESVLRTVIQ